MSSKQNKFYPLVSCIVPVYNAENYLDQGIKSLLNQTYKKVEIILVDDHSTDSSWEICQKYAQEYSNVKVYKTKTNSGGPLRGREKGIQEAQGEWITFMDCDDYVKPEYIDNLVKTVDEGKFDIAVTGHSRLYSDGRLEDFKWTDYSQATVERLKTFFNHYFLDENFWTDPTDTVGQNLIRASIAKKTDLSIYPDKIWGEDTLMALAFLANSKKGVNFVDHHDFIWRQRQGSGSHGGFSMTANRPDFYRACFDIFNKKNIMPIVSVIIPMFKVEKFLAECVESVTAQTYPGLEIILVNDKSPDKSGALADKIALKDDRIKVIHKSVNEGLNMARYTGFEASKGHYTIFVDSDDILHDDCIRIALSMLLKENVDFVRFSMQTFESKADIANEVSVGALNKKIILESKKSLYMTQFNPGEYLGDLSMISMTVWGALYTRKSVEHINWIDTNFRVYEDNIWTLRYLENVKSGAYTSYVGYYYRSDIKTSDSLSKRLTGNSLNGKPIGYMEYWSFLWSEYYRYNKKYSIGADKVIENVVKHLTTIRADYLTKFNLWDAENNAEYLPTVAKMYQESLDDNRREVALKDVQILKLNSENAHIRNELSSTQAEIRSYLSIKRSAKLTLGNVKRRIMHINHKEV